MTRTACKKFPCSAILRHQLAFLHSDRWVKKKLMLTKSNFISIETEKTKRTVTFQEMNPGKYLNLLLLLATCLKLGLGQGFGGSFNQFEACAGKDSIVLKSDGDVLAGDDGWSVYNGGLIFCCDGIPYDALCSELLIGYCDCPTDEPTTESEYETSVACYARHCTDKIIASPIEAGVQVKSGHTAMCYLPEDARLTELGFANNITVSASDFCSSYHFRQPIPPPPPEKSPQVKGAFELIVNEETGRSSTGIVPVHMVMIPKSERVVMWTRGQQPNQPVEPDTEFAVSVVYDWKTGKYIPVEVDSNPFCSGVGFSKNGNILAFGGEQKEAPWGEPWQPTQIEDGRDLIREFDVETYKWRTVGELPGKHWYPTQTLLEDGRVLNQGGFEAMVGPQNEMFEIFDSTNYDGPVESYESTDFAKRHGIMNLYPFFSYLPYSDPKDPEEIYLLMDLCNSADLYSISKNNTLTYRKTLPKMEGADGNATEYCSAFSAVGFSRFLPFKPPYNKPEYIAFGGTINATKSIEEEACWTDIKGSDKSFRVSVDPEDIMSAKVIWEEEVMPSPRVGGLSVTLPNGELIIMNGAEQGTGNDYLRHPVRTAVLYDPDAPAGSRYREAATSGIKRLYHNVAMLLPTGEVLVAGGEQGEAYSNLEGPWCGSSYEYTYEAEFYKPPYVFTPELRPRAVNIEGGDQHAFGSTIRVYHEDKGLAVDGATITSPSAVTHGLEMSSRTAFLEVVGSGRVPGGRQLRNGVSDEGLAYVDLLLPKQSHRVTTSGWHMLFLLNGKSPSHEALWINITD